VAVEAQPRFGMEMVVPVPSENAPELEAVAEPREVPTLFTPPSPRSVPAGQAAGASPAPATEAPSSTRGAFPRGFRDSRLYVTPSPLPPPDTRTEHERYMDHLQARIDAVNDSMAVAANRERRTADWTVTDASGNRWGLSPDGLHLGGVTVPRAMLPMPAPTGDNRALEGERERQRQRDEIRAQEEARERRRIQEERREATRREQDERR
jgi:hypothetical protein